MTFIDVVVGIAVFAMVFVGLFTAFTLAAELALSTKAKIGGMALADNQIERIRALPYSAVGTTQGVPSGELLSTEERVLNGIEYTIQTTVVYGTSDADYKRVSVEVSWEVHERARSTMVVTIIAPFGV